jgi:hypothetical protein
MVDICIKGMICVLSWALAPHEYQARTTESSLQRLRRGARQRGAGAGTETNDNNISDNLSDKICAQLFLDVQEYGRRLAALGIAAADMTAYTSLWQCVAPPDRQNVVEF